MNLIGFQPYKTTIHGAKTSGVAGCGCDKRGARTGATSWTGLSASLKKALTPQLKLWPTVHVGADATSPVTTATTTVGDMVAIAGSAAAAGAVGYFIGGGTKSNWVPVLGGSFIGALSRIGIILGGILGYAGAHYARK